MPPTCSAKPPSWCRSAAAKPSKSLPTASSVTRDGGTASANASAPSRPDVLVALTSVSSIARLARISGSKRSAVTPARSGAGAGSAAGAASEAPSTSPVTATAPSARMCPARRARSGSRRCPHHSHRTADLLQCRLSFGDSVLAQSAVRMRVAWIGDDISAAVHARPDSRSRCRASPSASNRFQHSLGCRPARATHGRDSRGVQPEV